MRLISIRLAGFKSFVDPVTVPFDGNMTAIVGPNGCGKSNIIDAVRWVMGESSAKTLRGESMADVIFNGATGRKPVGQAAIELRFDNRDGSMGGLYAQYAEIAVKRLVTRDGQSSYFFNGQKCRRRDIADLFMGTGLGPRSYAIIGQGMISRLIEARPDDLRATLEEAAGISKYKERRRETENRMRRTQENLERLDDIREELDKQLDRLKRQAEAAQRYRDLKQQEYRLKGELALLRGRTLRAEQTAQENRVNELETAVERDVLGVRQCESRLEQARLAHDRLAEDLDRHQQRFFETTTAIARLEQDSAHRRSRDAQLASDIAAAVKEQVEQRQIHAGDAERLETITQRLAELAPEQAALEEQLGDIEETQQQCEPAARAAEQAWEEANAGWQQASRDAERRQDQLRDLESRITRHQADIQRRHQQRSELESFEALEIAHQQALERLAIAEDQTRAFAARRETLQQARTERRDAQQRFEQERDLCRDKVSQCQGELASLQALLDVALADHDPQLSEALKQRGLENAPRLGETLDVADGWERVVSWVLAPWLNARLVGTQQLSLLDSQVAADWQLVDAAQSGEASAASLAALVSGAGALSDWLSRIHCVDSGAEALAMAARLPDHSSERHSVLSRDGVWCGNGWLCRQGEGEGVDALLVTRRRYADTQQQLEHSLTQLEACESKRLEESERLHEVEQSLDTLAQEERDHATDHQRLALQERELSNRLMHLKSRGRELDEELTQLQADASELELTLDEQREQWDQAMTRLEEAALAREQAEQARQAAREQLGLLRERHAPLKDRQQALALETQRLMTERDGLLAQQSRSDDTQERLALRIAELEEMREALIEPDELGREELDELLERRAREEQGLNQVRQQSQALAEQLRADEQARQQHERSLEQSREHLQQRRMDVQALSLKAAAQEEQLAELGHDAQVLGESLAVDATETAWQQQLETTTEKIRRLGAINLAAIEEYEQQAERRNYLEAQHQELSEALETLERAIRRIDQETRLRFRATFDQVNKGLQVLFPRVFGGGAAWLTLTGDDLLETGVAIMARPPGKKNSTIHLLSGGEKALTALSLVFAIFQLNPAPFCMLDEVDAPLDDANVGRYAKLVKEMSESVQFIYITHNKIAMEAAERLMGVTMQEPGVSRLVSVGVEEAAALADASI
ncbi:chromosome segregation protein SMC [Halomonas sp. ZH2S]|uniref:Chromosome partition protein Smc n=1 Tax=Vreelandella zhuhanensis TaxID=2684210 RepID=A0A7X3KQB9_9GAMM|nr:chromosome segregation protein SMC [Halomonas zhuhanensis]MWJ27166.1 chromosome segregation protein SMC [Halomonas zhuhanensis]